MLTEAETDGTPIRACIRRPSGSFMVMTGFPGLEIAPDGAAHVLPEITGLTLDVLAGAGVTDLLVLAEPRELPEGGLAVLAAAAAERGQILHPLPIADFSVPEPDVLNAWHAMRDSFARRPFALCCQYGAGRSGLFAAMVLIEDGLAPKESIAAVRSAFHEAIENRRQEDWLTDTFCPGRNTR